MVFQLQLLHASDLEGGVDAIERASFFAAIVDTLEDTNPNTVVISAGDNYIPGPFFSAAGDPAVRSTLRSVYQSLYGLTSPTDLRELEGRIDISIMNVIGFDASALGNHEFDLGTNNIFGLINDDIRNPSGSSTPALSVTRWFGAQFPYLSANLDFSADPNLAALFTANILDSSAFFPIAGGTTSGFDEGDLAALRNAPKLAPATVVDADGNPATTDDRIGVIAATTPLLQSISSPGLTQVKNPGAGTNNMALLASILQPVIDDVINGADNILGTADDINKIVLTTHLQQIQLEQQLVPLLRGVDISIAGGSDTLLADATDTLLPGDTADGNYPIITTNADGNPAVVVSTDGEYSYVGRLVVEFDANGVIIPGSINPNISGAFAAEQATLTNLGVANPAATTKGALVQQLTDAVEGVVLTQDSNIFGFTNVFIEGRRDFVRTEETTLGNLTADANLAEAKKFDPATVISIKNGGGIRNPIGDVTNDGGVTLELPPQPNPSIPGSVEGEISQLDINNSLRFNNGLTLVTITAQELERILEHGVAATAPGATPGQFPQVSGVSFSFDATRPSIQFNSQGVVTREGERILSLVVTDTNGDVIDVVVENGQLVGDPNREFRVVTLNFLATASSQTSLLGGDNYPFPAFASNVVNLTQPAAAPRTGGATFAPDGSEQDALAEYLLTTFPASSPFNAPETDPELDTRIRNLGLRNEIIGTDDADVIVGGAGADILTGDTGNDQFVFNSIRDSGDRITDFTVGEDTIVLTGLLSSIGYAGTNAFTDGTITVSGTTSPGTYVVNLDVDGSVGTDADPTAFIVVQGPATLADLNVASNFVF